MTLKSVLLRRKKGRDSKIEKHGVFAALIMSFPSEFIVFQKDQGKFIHFLDVQTSFFPSVLWGLTKKSLYTSLLRM